MRQTDAWGCFAAPNWCWWFLTFRIEAIWTDINWDPPKGRIFRPTMIHLNLSPKLSILYYSLIGGFVSAVICRWYYRNRSDDLNPILTIFRITLIHQRGRLKKTGKPVKTQTTRCWFFLPPSSQENEDSFKCDTHNISNLLRDFIAQR